MLTGKFSVVLAAITLAWAGTAATGHAQGANSAAAQRLAAQKNQAAFQRTAAQRAAVQRSYAPATGQYGATTSVRPATAGVSSARGGVGGSVRSTASAGSLSGISTALSAFSADVGRMPTMAEGLGALLKAPPGVRNWRGPYISQVNWHAALADPWGNQYRYNVQGAGRSQMYTISSDGPDRTYGTADDLSVQF